MTFVNNDREYGVSAYFQRYDYDAGESITVEFMNLPVRIRVLFDVSLEHGRYTLQYVDMENNGHVRRVSAEHPSLQPFVNHAKEVARNTYPPDSEWIEQVL